MLKREDLLQKEKKKEYRLAALNKERCSNKESFAIQD